MGGGRTSGHRPELTGVRVLLASPLGFLIGLSLGALGAGGSVLAVPALVYAAGQGARDATTTSLLVVGVSAAVGMMAHHRAGRVRLGTGTVFGVVGIAGSVLGSAVNRHLDPNVLLLSFSVLVAVAAWRMVVGCPTCTRVGEERALLGRGEPSGRAGVVLLGRRVGVADALAVAAAGTGIGFLTGLFGVGGGFVIVPALTLLLRLNMPEAIGTSLLVIVINSASALATRLATTSVDWAVALPFTAAAVAGVLVGKQVGLRLDPQQSLRWFAGLLAAVALYTAVRAVTGL
ncbi:MAG TPA: sulfite exporter TauE/SafE family protein [Acidimicrobiales bacterium]|nr:sulfite exporter TauE/SafE family protein [Acidimicrobiales bacterium]